MNNSNNNLTIFLEEGLSIVDNIINNDIINSSKNYSIYDGNAGLGFLLIEAYEITQDNIYLDKICSIANQIIDHDNKENVYSLYCGYAGKLLYLLEVYKITKKTCYLEYVRNNINIFNNFNQYNNNECDLLIGFSGTLILLLKYYDLTKESYAVKIIKMLTEKILSEAILNFGGITWGLKSSNIKPLCGFSHGACGIGSVLFEIGNYFGNNYLISIAQQAFQYENQYYDASKMNWPDFRMESRVQFYSNMSNGLSKFDLNSPGDISVWCHGAIGIGLSRLRVYEILGNDNYKVDIQNSLERAILDTDKNFNSFSLCHGLGGHGMFFLKVFSLFKENKYYEIALKIANMALSQKSIKKIYESGNPALKGVYDETFFNGEAGVAYFYLKLYSRKINNNILSFTFDNKLENKSNLYSELDISKIHVVDLLSRNHFDITIKFIKYFDLQDSMNNINLNSESLNKNIIKYFEDSLKYIPTKYKVLYSEILSVELKICETINKIQNLYKINHEKLISISESSKLKNTSFLVLSDDINLFKTKYNWIRDYSIFEPDCIEESTTYFITTLSQKGLVKRQISKFGYLILSNFKEQSKVESIIEKVYKMVEVENIEISRINLLVTNQLTDFIKAGVLLMKNE